MGTTKFGAMSGSRYEKCWKPLDYKTNFQDSHRPKQHQSIKERERKTELKQIFLRLYNVALSLIAAIVCWKYAETDRVAQWTEIPAAFFHLENIFIKDFKLF